MARQKRIIRKASVYSQLQELVTLPVTPPTGVHGNPVKNWDKRTLVASKFFANYQSVKADIKVNPYNSAKPPSTNEWIYEVTYQPNTFIGKFGRVDGAEQALRSGKDAKQIPVMVIAANRKHIGGSLYRVGRQGKTGDAQEEQAGNTYAGALALASCPGVSKGVEAGNICYTKEYSQLLSNRGVIEVTNVPGIEQGKVCDQLLVAAPDLKKKECFTKTGEFDYQRYQNEIYTMYSNLFSAIAQKDPKQPIILTLPGAGVFLGDDENVRKQAIIIQGLCLRRVLHEKAEQLQGRQMALPHALDKGSVNDQIMNIVKSDPNDLIDTIDELKRLQMAQKNKMFAAILEILDDAEAKAKELINKGAIDDGKKIKENIDLIKEELLFAYPALNGDSKNINLNEVSQKILGLVDEIQPIAARHGGLKQDLMYLAAAIMDVFSLCLTTLIPNSAFKVGLEGDLVNFRQKFGLFKDQLQQQIKPQEDILENDETSTRNLSN